ncbi:MAG: tetratricopeptide repeat protein [Sedimentisphaerales bacterium]|nr:tetratricopeptide repeat protein [Sedimentisphaerales bacterium]
MNMDATLNDASQQHDSTQHYEVLQELGDCHNTLGDYSQAQKYYEQAATLAPDEPGPYVGLGVIALQENRLDDAETAFRVACRLDNRCVKGYAGLGITAQQKTDYKRAFEMYLKCLELDSDNLIALLGLFQASCEMGSFSEITHYLEVYLDMHPGDTSVMFPLASLYMKDGRFDECRKILLDLLALDESHKDAIALLEEVEHSLTQTRQPNPNGKECALEP